MLVKLHIKIKKTTNLVKQCHKLLIWIDGFNPTREDDDLGDSLPIALLTIRNNKKK